MSQIVHKNSEKRHTCLGKSHYVQIFLNLSKCCVCLNLNRY